MKDQVLIWIAIFFVVFVVLIAPFILYITVDSFTVWWDGLIGVKKADVKREIFKHNKSYIEGHIQDLLRYKLDYELAKEEDEKKAIAFHIRHNFANFDESYIDNQELVEFLQKIKRGEL